VRNTAPEHISVGDISAATSVGIAAIVHTDIGAPDG
jgi:hypothetical protein